MTAYYDFSLGLATQAPRLAADTSSKISGMKGAKTATNVLIDETGVRTGTGYSRIFDDTLEGIVQGIHYYRRRGTLNIDQLIAIANGKLEVASGSSWVTLGTGLSTSARSRMITYNGYTLIANGVDPVKQFDGTTMSSVTFNNTDMVLPATFRPTFMFLHRGRLFYGGDAAFPYRLFTPVPGTHNDFTGAQTDAFDVAIGDGQPIVGCIALTKGYTVILKTGSIHLLTGSNPTDATIDPFVIAEYSNELGCTATDSILSIGTEVFFMSQRGYKKLSYVSVTGNITDADPMYLAQPELDAYDPDEGAKCNAVFNAVDRMIYLTFPVKSGGLTTLCYNVVTKGIMKRDGFNTTVQIFAPETQTHYFARVEPEDNPNRVYRKSEVSNYDGITYASEWESLFQVTGLMNQRKFFGKFLAYFRTLYGSQVQVGIRIVDSDGSIATRLLDFGDTTGTDGWDIGKWDEAIWDYALASVARKSRVGRGVALSVFFKAKAGAAFWVDRIEFDSWMRGADQR